MTVELNHTIVPTADKWATARWLVDLLDLPEPRSFGPFTVVQIGPTSLDFIDDNGEFRQGHYAFLVSDDIFDRALTKLQEQGVEYWPEPGPRNQGQINHNDGGRGCYFSGPTGHGLEILTVPYGGWPD